MLETITMYHATTTGEHDENLASICDRGITLLKGHLDISHQKNGFFVGSSEAYAKKHAIGFTEGYGDAETKRPGKPMLITLRCNFGSGFDLDYEETPELAKEILRKFEDKLVTIPQNTLKLREGYVINKIRSIKEGVEIGLIKEDRSDPKTIFMSWHKRAFTPWYEKEKKTVVAEAGLLQVLRDYLVSTIGDEYISYEADYIKNAIPRFHEREYFANVSMKCHGSTSPEIIKLDIFNGHAWETITLPRQTGYVPGMP